MSAQTLTRQELADALLGLNIIVQDGNREVTAPVKFPIATAAAIFMSAGKEVE